MKNVLIHYMADILQQREMYSARYWCQPSSSTLKCFLWSFMGTSLKTSHCMWELHLLKVWVLKTVFKIIMTEVHNIKVWKSLGLAQLNRFHFCRESMCLNMLKLVWSPTRGNNWELFTVDEIDSSIMRLYLFGDCILKFVVLEYFEYKCHPGHVLLNNGP